MNDYNASDTRAIRRATKAAKQAEAERRGVVFSIMASPAGRSWMHDRLVRCHVFTSSFSNQSLAMAFAEGERNIGLQDLNDIMQFAPDQYIQMMREANDRSIAANSGPVRDQQNGRRGDSSGSSDDDQPGTVLSDYDPADEGRDDLTH